MQLLGLTIHNCTETAVLIEPPRETFAADQVLALPAAHPGAVIMRDVSLTHNTGCAAAAAPTPPHRLTLPWLPSPTPTPLFDPSCVAAPATPRRRTWG